MRSPQLLVLTLGLYSVLKLALILQFPLTTPPRSEGILEALNLDSILLGTSRFDRRLLLARCRSSCTFPSKRSRQFLAGSRRGCTVLARLDRRIVRNKGLGRDVLASPCRRTLPPCREGRRIIYVKRRLDGWVIDEGGSRRYLVHIVHVGKWEVSRWKMAPHGLLGLIAFKGRAAKQGWHIIVIKVIAKAHKRTSINVGRHARVTVKSRCRQRVIPRRHGGGEEVAGV